MRPLKTLTFDAFRDDLAWLLPPDRENSITRARSEAQSIYSALERRGALFMHDLAHETNLIPSRLEDGLSELAALGLVTADGFAALRLLVGSKRRRRTYNHAGRWTHFPGRAPEMSREERVQRWAQQLIRRYGVVFRDLLERETVTPAWWELVSVYRRMEARGEIRGGRFVSGVAAEQYALPEAVESLRRPRESENNWVAISAADPLNLTGIVLPGPRIPATRGNRLLFHNGKVAGILQAGETQILESTDGATQEKITHVLRLTQLPQLREELLKELSLRSVST